MILRYVACDPERWLECTVGYIFCSPCKVNMWKKRLKKQFTFEFNGSCDIQFKTFEMESDNDEI